MCLNITICWFCFDFLLHGHILLLDLRFPLSFALLTTGWQRAIGRVWILFHFANSLVFLECSFGFT